MEEVHGIQACQQLGDHKTQAQTTDYVRHKKGDQSTNRAVGALDTLEFG